MAEDTFFDKFGLQVGEGDVEIGKTYPLYGAITKILDESFENFTIQINHGIVLRCAVDKQEFISKIKERAFEPGIFVTTITDLKPVTGDCATIVFGRKRQEELM